MDEQGRAAIAGIAAVLHKSYLHQKRGDTTCAICGATTKPLAFHVLEKSYTNGDAAAPGFVPMSESMGRVSGVFPVCVKCSPACRKCRLPISTERVIEFGISVDAHKGCGVCEHMHLSVFIEVLWKRLLGHGRFKR
jgi:hypothetical protein